MLICLFCVWIYSFINFGIFALFVAQGNLLAENQDQEQYH